MPASRCVQRLRLNRTASSGRTGPTGKSASGVRRTSGATPDQEELLDLQRDAGNRAVARLIADAPGRDPRKPLAVQRDREPRKAESTGAKLADSPPTYKESGPPPPLKADEEDSYKTQGDARLTDLGGAAEAGEGGHTSSKGGIEGFPDWWVKLQRTLIESKRWRKDKEEVAQNLLADYAQRRFAVKFGGDVTKIPPSILTFLKSVGRSVANWQAATTAGLPSVAPMGGMEGAANWCAQAGSSSVQLVLRALGLEPEKRSWNSWLTGPPVPKIIMQQASADAKIEPGDQVSYIEAGLLAVGGHTVTALTSGSGEGSTFMHVSGNAGGGKGSVRIGTSLPRGKIRDDVTWKDIESLAPSDKKLSPPPGVMWGYIIVKYSRFWEDLGKVDTKAANVWQSPPGADFLKAYQLHVGSTK